MSEKGKDLHSKTLNSTMSSVGMYAYGFEGRMSIRNVLENS